VVIALCFDANFQNWATVTLFSVSRNCPSGNKTRLFLITEIQFNDCIPQLKRVLRKFDFTFIYPDDEFETLPVGFHFSSATYWRLLLPKLLYRYNVEKAIYLDADVLVKKKLQELYDTDINGYACAGVVDVYSKRELHRLNLRQDFVINGGVLLMNIPLMAAIDWPTRAIELNLQKLIKWVDQDVLNCVLDGRIKCLPAKWNVQSMDFGKNEVEDLAIVHFTEGGNAKPWSINCQHPMVGLYRYYLLRCGFVVEAFKLEKHRIYLFIKKRFSVLLKSTKS
jgi:lipopolysaccharide biosynthesis glycosyltransferase